MVLETSQERPAPVEPGTPSAAPPAAASAAPPAVRPAEPAAEFELETAYEAAGMQWQGGGAAAAAPASPGVEAAPEPPRTEPPASVPPEAAPASVSFSPVVPPDVEGVGERTIADVPAPFVEAEQTVAERTFEYAFGAPRAAVTPEVEPAPEEPPSASPPLPPLPEPVALAAAAPPPVPPPAPRAPLEATPPKAVPAAREDETELVSPTLAELYFNQGFPEKAIEVYRRLLEKEPGNERARARMAELQQPGAAPADAAGAPPLSDQARAARREALERTIERLESLRAALQKGAR
jgi:tetratricopeptide (TPR) repeat protein